MRESYSSHSLNYNQATSRASLKSCAEEYDSSKRAPLGAFQYHICVHVILARCHKMSPKALPLVNSYDTHSSKITLLLVLLS